MDPNATLAGIRAILESEETDLRMRIELWTDLAELVHDLDNWLSSGGFLPTEWERENNG